jgi:zinc/manganese transport system substrate-binding protein
MLRCRSNWRLLLVLPFLFAVSSVAEAQQKLKVVASFSILADMAREVGGERIEVQSLVGANGDAHAFQPTPSDARAVSQASVLIVNGLGFEGWLDRLQRSSGFKGKVVVASDRVTALAQNSDGHGHKHKAADPHAWQDLANGNIYVDNIARGLSDADAANAAFYKERAQAYKQRLSALDAKLRSEFAAMPKDKRRVITSHDAFAYFGKAYDITFIPAAGSGGDGQPSAKQIAALIAQVRKENVKALFLENMSNAKLIEQIGRDAGASIGGTLYSDALSVTGGAADSYIKMFEHNAATLKAGMLRN